MKLFVSALASSSATSLAERGAATIDEVAGLRTEARAEIGVPLAPERTGPVLATPFGVDGVAGGLVVLVAPGDDVPLDSDDRSPGLAVEGLLRFDDMVKFDSSDRIQQLNTARVSNRPGRIEAWTARGAVPR